MDDTEMLREYATRSAAMPLPHVDVTTGVLKTIRQTAQPRARWAIAVRPLAGVAAASWLLVFSLGLVVQQPLLELQDPLTSLVSQFAFNMQ